MMVRNAAIIKISARMLLKMLDFEGGILHRIYRNEEQWNPDDISLVIEHPDLDEVYDGFVLRSIKPTYTTTYGENGGVVRVERSHPPKQDEQ